MTTHTTDIQAEIHTMAKNFISTFKSGNAAAVAEFYTDNAMLLPAGFDFVRGREEIESFWQGAMNMGIKAVNIDIMELEQHGDTAIEVGRYTMMDADGQVLEAGKGMVIWKYENDAWKLHRDIWNSDATE